MRPIPYLALAIVLVGWRGAPGWPPIGPTEALAQCQVNPPRGFPHEPLATDPRPTPLVAQRFCLAGRRGEMWTTAPSGAPLGGPAVRLELRAGPTPEAALAAAPMNAAVRAIPDPPYSWTQLSWRFLPPRDGLFYAATAIDADGLATEPVIVAAGSIQLWGVTTDRRMTLTVRFPVGLHALGLPGEEIGIAVREGWSDWTNGGPNPEYLMWDATVPATAVRRGRVFFRDPFGTAAHGIRRLDVRGKRRARLRLRAVTDRPISSDLPLRLVLRIGDRELDLGGSHYPHAGE